MPLCEFLKIEGLAPLLIRRWVFQAACTLPIGVQAAIGLNL